MYRLVILLVALQAIAANTCHHPSRCAHRRHDYKAGSHRNDGDFHTLSWGVVRIDRNAQRVCDENSNHTTETFHTSHYEISVPLPDFTEQQISVKLKHRVLFIQAIAGSDKVHSEIKIIPSFAKGKEASWDFNDNVLNIFIPYEVTLGTEVVRLCNTVIDEAVATIPKSSINVKFGDDTTTESVFSDENIF